MSTTVLWRIWQHGLRTAPTPLRRGEQIGCWRSPVGLIFFHPMIAGDGAFYTSMYGRINVAEEFKRSAAKRPEFIEAARHIAPGAKVLEIGAGTGSFAQHLAPSVQYTGLDPHSVDYAGGHQMAIKTETLEAHLASHAGHYDVACAFQVIEHVPDPLGTARDMLRSLRPGGLLILVAPVWPSPMTRIPNFPINIPPHHLTCWNPNSMRALALAAGAEPVAAHTLPPSPHVERILWMARLCPIKAPVNGPWVAARWSWVVSLGIAWLLAFPATLIRSSPPGAEPIDVMLVARKPLGAAPETSAGAEMVSASGASPA
jgi:2-polyprenyl-3-methyl-5-hydroxy-6-metoxy-1,4-benzoquinol methylase